MPRLNGEEYIPGPPVPEGCKPSDELFVVRASGEGVRTYEEYITKTNLYRRRDWQNAVTGKGQFTYEEALQDEEKTLAQLAKFPKDVEGQVVRMVHHSAAKLDDLLASVWDAFSPAPGSSDKENEAGPRREGHPLGSKRVIRTFLGEVAEKTGGLWVCKPKYVDKWGLAKEVPDDKKALLPGSSKKKPAAKRESLATAAEQGDESRPARPPLPPPRSLEEEEARLKPGTVKAAAFSALKAAGAPGLTVPALLEAMKAADPEKEWPKSAANMLTTLFGNDTAFCRVARGTYALRALPGVAAMPEAPKSGGGGASGGGASGGGASGGGGGSGGGASGEAAEGKMSRAGSVADVQAAGAAADADALAAAEGNLKKAKAALAARQREMTSADAALASARAALDGARAAQAGAGKGGGGGGASPAAKGGDVKYADEPKWELPEELRGDYTGPADDRKAMLSFRKAKADAEKKLAQRREKWLQEKRLLAVKAAQSTVATLKAAADKAASAREAAAGQFFYSKILLSL